MDASKIHNKIYQLLRELYSNRKTFSSSYHQEVEEHNVHQLYDGKDRNYYIKTGIDASGFCIEMTIPDLNPVSYYLTEEELEELDYLGLEKILIELYNKLIADL